MKCQIVFLAFDETTSYIRTRHSGDMEGHYMGISVKLVIPIVKYVHLGVKQMSKM